VPRNLRFTSCNRFLTSTCLKSAPNIRLNSEFWSVLGRRWCGYRLFACCNCDFEYRSGRTANYFQFSTVEFYVVLKEIRRRMVKRLGYERWMVKKFSPWRWMQDSPPKRSLSYHITIPCYNPEDSII